MLYWNEELTFEVHIILIVLLYEMRGFIVWVGALEGVGSFYLGLW